MKILVFSDTHLSLPFEEKKFNFLSQLIKSADKVIINGDFWEGALISFEQFIYSPWRHLFSLLKSRHTVYIYGNHDSQELTNPKVALFSDQQMKKYYYRLNGTALHFEHGDAYAPVTFPLLDRLFPDDPPKLVQYLNFLEKILIKTGGFVFTIREKGRRLNQKIKLKIADKLKPTDIFICGHTHCKEIDRKEKFLNTGFIKHGLAQYLIIDEHELKLKEEWYE